MSQIKVINGDLYVIFEDSVDDNSLITHKLDNGAEFDFCNDKFVQLVLPDFEVQLNRGSLENVPMELLEVKFDSAKMILPIKIMDDTINISLDCSSIIHKI